VDPTLRWYFETVCEREGHAHDAGTAGNCLRSRAVRPITSSQPAAALTHFALWRNGYLIRTTRERFYAELPRLVERFGAPLAAGDVSDKEAR